MRSNSIALAAALALVLAACDEPEVVGPVPLPEGTPVPVRIDPATRAGTLHERYIGFAFDTAQLTGGTWWRPDSTERHVTPTPDLESAKLRKLVSYLAPSLMRIGGTDCDSYYFCEDGPGECTMPGSYRDVYTSNDRIEAVMSQDDVARVAALAAAVDSEVLFCVNFGPGPRDPVTGEWSPDNARALIAFARSQPGGERFTYWEPGNEINGAGFHFAMEYDIDAALFADGLEQLRRAVDELAPGARIPAPGSYILPYAEIPSLTPQLMAELDSRPPGLLDIASWHLYASQSTACPFVMIEATPEALLSEDNVDTHRERAAEVRDAASGRPVWNTESASAQCGGQFGVSDSMADALWYMDWLGVMAEEGNELVVRHSLVGADYSLLEPESFDPRPTFLGLVMMRRTVRDARLDTSVDRSRLKAHGYCSARGGRGAVTAVLVNPAAEARVAQLALDGAAVISGRQWTLSSGGDLGGKRASINGQAAAEDGTIPDPQGAPVAVREGAAHVGLGPYEVAFAVLELNAPAAACP